MKRKIAMRWADLLESGRYKQGKNALCRLSPQGAEHCCLGVLSEMATKEGATTRAENGERVLFGGNANTPPAEVMKWSGLKDNLGRLPKSAQGKGSTLADQNDHGATFAEIAALIRKHWRYL